MRRGDLVADDVVTDIMREEVLAPNAVGGFVSTAFRGRCDRPRRPTKRRAGTGLLSCRGAAGVPAGRTARPVDRAPRLTQRADDTSVTIHHRVEVYLEKTSPLIDYYEGRDVLVDRRHAIHRRSHRFDQRPTRPPGRTTEALVAPGRFRPALRPPCLPAVSDDGRRSPVGARRRVRLGKEQVVHRHRPDDRPRPVNKVPCGSDRRGSARRPHRSRSPQDPGLGGRPRRRRA